MCILPYPDGNWRDFFGFIGRAELAADPRFGDVAQRVVHIDQLYQLVEQHAALQSTDSWMAFCDRVSIPCMPVLELEQLEHDPHVVAVGLMELVDHPSEGRYRHLRSPLRFSATPYHLHRHAPRAGEHTREVLLEVGMSEDQVQALVDSQPT